DRRHRGGRCAQAVATLGAEGEVGRGGEAAAGAGHGLIASRRATDAGGGPSAPIVLPRPCDPVASHWLATGCRPRAGTSPRGVGVTYAPDFPARIVVPRGMAPWLPMLRAQDERSGPGGRARRAEEARLTGGEPRDARDGRTMSCEPHDLP